MQNTDLNINNLLINWCLMSGYLHDGIIESTKFDRFNLWFTFCLSLFHGIKWTILLFSPKDSQMTNLLGEWAYYLGLKIIFDLLIIFLAIYVISVKLLFVYASKHPQKMFNWINVMKFNPINRSFDKLNLTKAESKLFIKRLSISFFLCRIMIYPISFLTAFIIFILIFVYQNDYHLNYLISLICFLPQIYLNVCLTFGFIAILYPVSLKYLRFFMINIF